MICCGPKSGQICDVLVSDQNSCGSPPTEHAHITITTSINNCQQWWTKSNMKDRSKTGGCELNIWQDVLIKAPFCLLALSLKSWRTVTTLLLSQQENSRKWMPAPLFYSFCWWTVEPVTFSVVQQHPGVNVGSGHRSVHTDVTYGSHTKKNVKDPTWEKKKKSELVSFSTAVWT